MPTIGLSQQGIEMVDLARRKKGWTTKEIKWYRYANCSDSTLVRFQHGERVEQETFVALCKAVGIENWEDIVDKTPVARKKNQESENEQPKEIPFQPLPAIIASKLEGFVGREYVFSAISEFINSKPNGYFTITADPGMGKSAILAKYVQDTECIYHFNIEQEGQNDPQQFLESICQQIIQRYQLPYSLSDEAKNNGIFLSKLLEEVAKKSNGNPVVIAVDALDEVDQSKQNKTANILYLPRYLPQGIYFITTVRRDANVRLMTDSPKQILNLLEEYQAESREDICTYVRNRVNNSETLRQWIKSQSVTQEKFIDEIANRSQNNFMYLFHVMRDIEENEYQDLNLEGLPTGLQEYYKFHWVRMGMNDEPRPMIKLYVVYHLAETRQPISCELISEYIHETPLTVQEILEKWLQFLHKRLIEDRTCYSIYHRSFSEFLHDQEIVKQAGVSLQVINKQKADYLWEAMFGDE
ncbi:MAG: hypothetical protein RLZZ507_2116 [Cyanobacteriota bacterium]|jgi:serine/threonine-protein kinase